MTIIQIVFLAFIMLSLISYVLISTLNKDNIIITKGSILLSMLIMLAFTIYLITYINSNFTSMVLHQYGGYKIRTWLYLVAIIDFGFIILTILKNINIIYNIVFVISISLLLLILFNEIQNLEIYSIIG